MDRSCPQVFARPAILRKKIGRVIAKISFQKRKKVSCLLNLSIVQHTRSVTSQPEPRVNRCKQYYQSTYLLFSLAKAIRA